MRISDWSSDVCSSDLFSVFDTATLAGAALGQTVLARALQASKLGYEAESAHSAIYDAEKTADLFCLLVNRMQPLFDETTASRSEEHTSELQSLMRISYAVFCLKKKIRQP